MALELFSEDGYLHDGEYTASSTETPGVAKEGEFVSGYDNEAWGDYGKNQGTCLFTMASGAQTGEKITDGLVTVSSREEKVDGKDVVIWTIFYGKEYPVQLLFEGTIPELTQPKKPVGPVNPNYLYTEVVTASGAVDVHAVTITDKDNNELAYLELLTEPGATDLSGSYPSTSYASQPGQMRDGYYIEYQGQIYSGGSYYVEGGEKKYIGAGTATVAVSAIATGAYRFSCEFFDYDCAGPDYVPEEGGDDDVTGDVVLKITSCLTYTMTDVTAGNKDASGNPLSGMTLWTVKVTQGEQVVAAFDLGTSEGSEALAAEYSVMSYPDAVGKAGNGWGMAQYNYYGGCYFMVDGAAYYIPVDAIVTVSANTDGTLKFKFEGNIQDANYQPAGTGGLLLNNVAKAD